MTQHVAIIGGGFCGLAAGYELAQAGVKVTVLEADERVGGLAGSFTVGGTQLEKFYHHWFTNDRHVMQLIAELGLQDQVVRRPSRTGMYFANTLFRLSTPLDLLRFTPLPFFDRIRLGVLTLRARRVKDWQALEGVTASAWLRQLGGERVYKVVWEPLLRGKFGDMAEEVSAVWFWNKLKLRGGSRGKGGAEHLAYFRGGFVALAEAMAAFITAQGGEVLTSAPVSALQVENGRATGVVVGDRVITVDAILATTALPIIAALMKRHVPDAAVAQLERIRYLANICIVLELQRSLSDIYWLNVNDPGFPFVGVIEHTNFEDKASYGGRHIAYLSKYLPENDALYQMQDAEVVDYTLTHLQRMFPSLTRDMVQAAHVWRARYAQPLVERHYSRLIPSFHSALPGLMIASMAQIYPEDRGTNYAIRQGRDAARALLSERQAEK